MKPDKILIDRYNELISEQEIIVSEGQQLIEFYKKQLNDLNAKGIVSKIVQQKEIETKPKIKFPLAIHNSKKNGVSLWNSIHDILISHDELLTANVFRENYNLLNGSDISVSNFSPRISELTKNSKLAKYVIEGNPINSKFVYGLPEWFENGIPKEEYLQKAKAGILTQLL